MSTIDLMNLAAGTFLALAFLVLSLWRGLVYRYIYLNLYCATLLTSSGVRQAVLYFYGFQSKKYFYTYFISDLVLTVSLYLVILSVFEIILRDSALRKQARIAFLACFAIVAAVSYFAIAHSYAHIYSRYVMELQQNMYFVSVVLTVLLCVALAHLRVADPQLRVIVFGLGAYAGMHAAGYALQNILPKASYDATWNVIRRMLPLASEIRLALWCAALLRVPAMSQVPAQSEQFPENAITSETHGFKPVLLRSGGRS